MDRKGHVQGGHIGFCIEAAVWSFLESSSRVQPPRGLPEILTIAHMGTVLKWL